MSTAGFRLESKHRLCPLSYISTLSHLHSWNTLLSYDWLKWMNVYVQYAYCCASLLYPSMAGTSEMKTSAQTRPADFTLGHFSSIKTLLFVEDLFIAYSAIYYHCWSQCCCLCFIWLVFICMIFWGNSCVHRLMNILHSCPHPALSCCDCSLCGYLAGDAETANEAKSLTSVKPTETVSVCNWAILQKAKAQTSVELWATNCLMKMFSLI